MKYYTVICLFLVIHYTAARDEQLYKKGVNRRIQELTDLTAKNPIISLNSSMFKDYARNPVRDYSFIIMFNSFKINCPLCKPMYEEYQLVVNTFRNMPSHDNNLFFGIVDFDTEPNVFDMMRLYAVPAIMHFPAKNEPAAAMDVDSFGIKAEAIAKWINNRADTGIRVQRKHKSEILLALNLLFIAAVLFYYRKNLTFIYNTRLWATEAVVFCFIMISGSMWQQENQSPNYEATKYGPKLFDDNSRGQYGFESYIVAVLNAAVVNGIILIVESAGGVNRPFVVRTPAETKVMRLRCLFGLLFVIVFFSLLLYVFRIKVPSYPFRLLF